MINRIVNIAIDGPSGAGKSTVARAVAASRGYTYLDTGAMYRAFALYTIQNGTDVSDVQAIEKLLDTFDLDIQYEGGAQQVIVNGTNVSSLIRTSEISMAASGVAKLPCVRLKLVELQRAIAKRISVVMDGRDIGSYVLKDADVKIFLTASPEARAGRRLLEYREKGNNDITYEETLKDIIKRDDNDSKRSMAPLVQAEDAILVDTTCLTLAESIDCINEIIDKVI